MILIRKTQYIFLINFFNKTSKPIVNNTLFLVIYKINRSENPIFNNTNVQLFFTDIVSLFIVKK